MSIADILQLSPYVCGRHNAWAQDYLRVCVLEMMYRCMYTLHVRARHTLIINQLCSHLNSVGLQCRRNKHVRVLSPSVHIGDVILRHTFFLINAWLWACINACPCRTYLNCILIHKLKFFEIECTSLSLSLQHGQSRCPETTHFFTISNICSMCVVTTVKYQSQTCNGQICECAEDGLLVHVRPGHVTVTSARLSLGLQSEQSNKLQDTWLLD